MDGGQVGDGEGIKRQGLVSRSSDHRIRCAGSVLTSILRFRLFARAQDMEAKKSQIIGESQLQLSGPPIPCLDGTGGMTVSGGGAIQVPWAPPASNTQQTRPARYEATVRLDLSGGAKLPGARILQKLECRAVSQRWSGFESRYRASPTAAPRFCLILFFPRGTRHDRL